MIYPVDGNLKHLVMVVLVFFLSKILFFPLLLLILSALEGSGYAQLTLKECVVMCYLVEGIASTLFVILLHGRFLFSSFIDLCNHLFISWTHGYLFYVLYYNPVLLCSSYCSNSKVGVFIVRSCVPLTHCGVFV